MAWGQLALSSFQLLGDTPESWGKAYNAVRFFQGLQESAQIWEEWRMDRRSKEIDDLYKKLEDPELDYDTLSQPEKDLDFFLFRFDKTDDRKLIYQISTQPQIENWITQLQELVVKQFLSYPVYTSTVPGVSNSPSLYAASAIASIWKGDTDIAVKSLDRAIELSANLPGSRIEVAKTGLWVADIITKQGNVNQGNNLKTRMQFLLDDARIEAFDNFDKLLIGCKTSQCSLEELLTWEAQAVRAGLIRKIPKSWETEASKAEISRQRDLAWLYGRFSYFIGISLKDPVEQRDRLRFLELYAQQANEPNRTELSSLKDDLDTRLKMRSYLEWILNPQQLFWLAVLSLTVIIIVLVHKFRNIIHQRRVAYLNRLFRNRIDRF